MNGTKMLKNKLKDKAKDLLNVINEYREKYYNMMTPSQIVDMYNTIMYLEQFAAEYRRICRLYAYTKCGYEICDFENLDQISKRMLDKYKSIISHIKIQYFKYLADDMINIQRKYFNSSCFENYSTEYIKEILNIDISAELDIQNFITNHTGYGTVEKLYSAINCILSLDCSDDYGAFYDVQNEKEYNHRISLLNNLEVNLKDIKISDMGLRNAIMDYLYGLFEKSGKLYLNEFWLSENK